MIKTLNDALSGPINRPILQHKIQLRLNLCVNNVSLRVNLYISNNNLFSKQSKFSVLSAICSYTLFHTLSFIAGHFPSITYFFRLFTTIIFVGLLILTLLPVQKNCVRARFKWKQTRSIFYLYFRNVFGAHYIQKCFQSKNRLHFM